MSRVVIYDSMSYLRLKLESKWEQPHLILRGIVNEASLTDRVNIFVWDAKGGNDARRKIFPNYKNRPPIRGDMFSSLQLLQSLLAFTPAWQASLEGYEADDVIAALVEHFRGKTPVQIVTRDADLAALCGPGVTCTAQSKIPTSLLRLYKTTWGDKSDTIPGIKGFGDKAWEEADKGRLGALIDKVLTHQHWDDEEALAVPMPKACISWMRANEDQVRAMHQIVSPMPIEKSQLEGCITAGKPNPAAIDAALKRYLQ